MFSKDFGVQILLRMTLFILLFVDYFHFLCKIILSTNVDSCHIYMWNKNYDNGYLCFVLTVVVLALKNVYKNYTFVDKFVKWKDIAFISNLLKVDFLNHKGMLNSNRCFSILKLVMQLFSLKC